MSGEQTDITAVLGSNWQISDNGPMNRLRHSIRYSGTLSGKDLIADAFTELGRKLFFSDFAWSTNDTMLVSTAHGPLEVATYRVGDGQHDDDPVLIMSLQIEEGHDHAPRWNLSEKDTTRSRYQKQIWYNKKDHTQTQGTFDIDTTSKLRQACEEIELAQRVGARWSLSTAADRSGVYIEHRRTGVRPKLISCQFWLLAPSTPFPWPMSNSSFPYICPGVVCVYESRFYVCPRMYR